MQSQTQVEVRYQAPTLDELKALAATAAADYESEKGDNQNPSRKSFLTLFNHLIQDPALMASEDAAKILMGAYVFAYEQIGSEKKYYFSTLHSPANSVLYRSLEKGLHITKDNKLTDEYRLICTSAFYNYVKTRAPKELAQDTTWMANDALRKPVLSTIKSLLKRLSSQLNIILSSTPVYPQLINNLQNMEECYNKMPSGFFGKSHVQLAKFIDLINDYCNDCLPHLAEEEADSLDPAFKYAESYTLRAAAAIFVMQILENECYLTPRSGLYQMCGKAIGYPTTKDINVEDRIAWIANLKQHLNNLQENRKEFIKQKEQGNYKNIRSELVKYQKLMSDFVDAYHLEKTTPSATHSTMVLATSGLAQTAMQSGFRNVVGDMMPTPASMVINTTAGAAGTLLFGNGIAAIAVTRFIGAYIVPFAIAGICAGVLDSAGTKIGEATTNVVTKPFKLSARGIKSLINWYRHMDIDKNALCTNQELLEALVSLPDDVFPSNKKAKIANSYGAKISLPRP